ncbi:hypothetical protein [Bacillus thuringiensis]|uniref:hypothetical protein n=1 Tax=Bacillus thuringiensis TaxID=1428 RepID=UPI0011AA5049|nr:hypothetical protein [Bacillus thuringiensis]
MKLQIVVDADIIKDLFGPVFSDTEKINRINKLTYHTLVGSNELINQWREALANNQLEEYFDSWLFSLLSSSNGEFIKVKLPQSSLVKGDCTEEQKVLLETAYQSDSKLIIGDYLHQLMNQNKELSFVSKKAFSQSKKKLVKMKEIMDVLDDKKPLKNDLFNVYESPLKIEIGTDDAQILAKYLSTFYSEKITIQDMYFTKNKDNERNFDQYILPYLNKGEVELNFVIPTEDGAKYKPYILKKYKDYNPTVKCIAANNKILHKGIIRSTDFEIQIGYRLKIFGENGKTYPETIHITKL